MKNERERLEVELTGRDLILRPITEEDTDDILKWRNKESVKKFFIKQKRIRREDHLTWIRNRVLTGEVVQFIMVSQADRCSMGTVYLQDIDHVNKKAEYGIFIGEDRFTGRGYGTIAAECMIKYAFDELKLHRLYLRVYEDNYRAISSYTKAGFKKEALLKDDVRIHGVYKNIVLMGIVKGADQ